MTAAHIFISHSSEDDGFVKALRVELERLGLPVWVDSRQLRGGDKLAPEIREAIAIARQVIVVLSPHTANSSWVSREIRQALAVEKQRQRDGYRVVPLLLPGIKPTALKHWFKEEPVAVPVQVNPAGLWEALPGILAALGERLADDRQTLQSVTPEPLEELLLELSDPVILTDESKHRTKATAVLRYQPTAAGTRPIESKRFTFTAPLGPIEAEDLSWYLERYYLWPTSAFQERARRIEAQLPRWGQDLYNAVLGHPAAHAVLNGWQQAGPTRERRFSVLVDRDLPEGASPEQQAQANEAATLLLSLPWELLHNGSAYLFQGAKPVRVRRRQPNRRLLDVMTVSLPIRILLLSPRPEDERTAYIDHRISALPLVEAVESFGKLVELCILTPPTLPALETTLRQAREDGKPFTVVHFDGHGIYDREHGLGGLCFENPKDSDKLQNRAMQLIHADKLAAMLQDYRIPLVFLEACQSAKTEENPTASVAARLLEEGVTSVVAMSHSVLVETARRFVTAFYQALAQGARVGQAMLAGQQALFRDSYRLKNMGAGELHLQDWFVPVLYQEEQDPQLFTQLPSGDMQQLQAQQRRLMLGALPESPPHRFIGRSRELLALERLLQQQPCAVIRGQGGSGKTTLAVELARWLVRIGCFQRAAFVTMDKVSNVRAVLDSLGRQLLSEGANWSVHHYLSLRQALQPVQRALRDDPAILVLDNLESVLPDANGRNLTGFAVEDLFKLCADLLQANPRTRLVFTSREPLPADLLAPLGKGGLGGISAQGDISLGVLDRNEAIELVNQVMTQAGWKPSPTDPGGTPQEVIDLVEAVNCHARALVLLSKEVALQGVRATTATLKELMADLHRKYPDDRERSLYASVQLSLRRLTPETREIIKALGVFHDGVSFGVLRLMLGLEPETVSKLGRELIQVGLAEDTGYSYLRLDSALPPYLLKDMSEAEQEQAKTAWSSAMEAFLCELQDFKEELLIQIIRLEFPNLLALLERWQASASAEKLIALAAVLEMIFNQSDHRMLVSVVAVRERAMNTLSAKNREMISSVVSHSNLATVWNYLQVCLKAGKEAYLEAIQSHFTDCANLVLLTTFFNDQLRDYLLHNEHIAHLVKTTPVIDLIMEAHHEHPISLDWLAQIIEEFFIVYAKKHDAGQLLASSLFHLAGIRLEQRRYREALGLYREALEHYEALHKLVSVASTWHQIGRVYRETGQFGQAEFAYLQALTIEGQQGSQERVQYTLGELGNLYDDIDRPQEAVIFHQLALDHCVEQHNQFEEGLARNNLGLALIRLHRYPEARHELRQAVKCKEPYGYSARPWTTWYNLYCLEQATEQPEAAAQARQRAIQAFLAYRRDSGENHSPGAQLCESVFQAIQQGHSNQAGYKLAQLASATEVADSIKLLISKLQAILNGSCDPVLADDPALYYTDAVELQLLLERLGEAKKSGQNH